MPIYEYECRACGKTTEAFQKFSDKALTKCPHCQGRLKKLISNTSFRLKGSGWYVTDYARCDQGGGKGEQATKGETKPEAKAEKSEKVEKTEKKDAE
jgi:putative FmdB family regulatory protein